MGKKAREDITYNLYDIYFIFISKTVQRVSPIHQEGNEPCFIHTIQYYCTTFTSRVNVLNENTVRTECIQMTLNFTI